MLVPKPNIVFIYADDLGFGETGFTGSKLIATPNLDRLAGSGMVFTQAYAGAGNCAPSRACLLSGTYTPRHEVYAVNSTSRGPKAQMRLTPIPNKSGLNKSVVTLAEALKARGYATGIFGKWHLAGPDGATPEEQGFDFAFDKKGDPDSAGKDPQDPKGIFTIEREAKDWIKKQTGKPFFAYVAHHAPHAQLESRPETFEGLRKKFPNATRRELNFAACVTDLDTSIGQLIKTLEDEGVRKNTIVVFTSDNGGTSLSQEPLRGSKGAYYEGGIKVPCLVSWPGVVQPGSKSTTPTVNVDFYPTLVELAGGKPEKHLDGTSLVPILKGSTVNKDIAKFWHFPGYLDGPVLRGRDKVFRTRPVTVMRKGDWKLIINHEEWLLDPERKGAVELYNIAKDPGETKDLVLEEVTKVSQLTTDVLSWMKNTGANFAIRPVE